MRSAFSVRESSRHWSRCQPITRREYASRITPGRRTPQSGAGLKDYKLEHTAKDLDRILFEMDATDQKIKDIPADESRGLGGGSDRGHSWSPDATRRRS